VQSKAWEEGLTTGFDVGGVSANIETGVTAMIAVWAMSGWADVLPRATASFTGACGREETRQQELSPDGASETSALEFCRACIIGQCSPPH